MGILDGLKNILNVSDDDFEEEEFEEEEVKEAETRKKTREEAPKKQEAPITRTFQGKTKTVQFPQQQMQVVLCKPERYEDVTSIAEHLCNHRTVVLNLEAADRDVSRRLVDFLSGAAYAKRGTVKKVANSTFLIVPDDVDVAGELVMDDFEDGRIYM